MELNELMALLREGESEHVEFKKAAPGDIYRDIAAMANAGGGHILIGVDDAGNLLGADVKRTMDRLTQSVQSLFPMPKIQTGCVKIERHKVVAIRVEKSSSLVSAGGTVYIRIGSGTRPLSVQEILTISMEQGAAEWDSAPFLPLNKMRAENVDWFFGKMEESRGRLIKKADRIRYLRSVGAIAGDRLTNAGALFFTDAREFIPHAGIRLVHLEGAEPTSSKEYAGPVWKMIDDSYRDIAGETSSDMVILARRRKLPGYPPRAIREAITNAVAHRNYAIKADTRIFIHADRLIVRNPGGLLPGVDLKDPEHIPRNPALCNLLYDCGYIERYGRGILLMENEVEKIPGLELNFDPRPYRFELCIRKKIGELIDKTDERIIGQLTEPKNSSTISAKAGLSKPAVLHRLQRLVMLGIVKKTGKGPQTKYAVI